MPELPDVVVYLEALERRILGRRLEAVRLASPFVLRTVDPPISALAGRRVLALRRMGKRLVWGLEDELFIVIHLMIAGRLRWAAAGAKAPGKIGLAAFDFENGTLLLTEAGSKRRASLHLVAGASALAAFERGGLEPLDASEAEFVARLRLREPHAQARPDRSAAVQWDRQCLLRRDPAPRSALAAPAHRPSHRRRSRSAPPATRAVLVEWTDRLRRETGEGFPEKVTAFRDGMAVHGRFRQPCPDCGTPIQRIRYAENETNYCPVCQTEGRLLADRGLSRLLREDWPRSLEELEERLKS